MLRKIRIALAAIFFLGITLLFYGIGQDWWGWMTHLQFLPSVLRVIASASVLNIAVLAALVALTLVFGRIYCSVICPLGVMQDLAICLRRWLGKFFHKPWRTAFRTEKKLLRYGFLILTVSALIAGLQLLVGIIAPYSAYGRIVRSISGESSLPVIIVAGVTFLLVSILAASMGRIWCNSVCPVGTVLGLFSRHSLLAPRIDTEKCVNCGSCGKKCKASCIDTANHKIDLSRCVMCFDCIDNCSVRAISYGMTKKDSIMESKSDSAKGMSRRAFLGTAILLGSAAATKAAGKTLPEGVIAKTEPQRQTPIVPPGARGLRVFSDICTACGLCISGCPNKVLRPSTDISRLMQPEMSFEKGWCRPECNNCAELCPTGAIQPLKPGEKAFIKIGTAVVDASKCFAAKGEGRCGNCVRKCPTGALRMLETEDGQRRPVVNEDICIGCGACEFLCPAKPVSAITVNGSSTHIKKA